MASRNIHAKYNNRCFWIGGAGVAYNYDAIAYNESGGVDPLSRILMHQSGWQIWFEGLGTPYGIMDLRGITQINPTSWINSRRNGKRTGGDK